MNIKSRIWLLLLLAMLAACATVPVFPIVSRPATVERFSGDGLTDDYVRFVEQGRSALRAGRLELARSIFLDATLTLLFERANYEIWIELAEVKCRLGKTSEAQALIQDYGVAIKVAHRQEQCLTDWGEEMTVSPNPRIPLRMYAFMCNAFVQSYSYADLKDEDWAGFDATYKKMKSETSILEEQCEAISE